jgi:hypothetical protein
MGLQDFQKVMSKLSDPDLIKLLLLERDQYQPDALEAAEAEFKKRNLSFQDLKMVKSKDGITLKTKSGDSFSPTTTQPKEDFIQKLWAVSPKMVVWLVMFVFALLAVFILLVRDYL